MFEWRYGSEEMRRVLSRDNLVEAMKMVEAALLEALAEAGVASRRAVEELSAALEGVSAEDVYRAEAETGHEVVGLVWLLAERAGGEAARWLHYGATSNDIVDTAWALVLRDALDILEERLVAVLEKLMWLADRYRGLVMAGRTHGQHAVPVTLGFKLANYVYELARSLERLREARRRAVRAKIGGAVGTMAAWGERGLEVRRLVAEKLGLEPHVIATQVAPRDGLAELAAALAILAGQLDRLAVEVRELARPEIGEVWEDRGGAAGSSAMPQKANPVTAERVSGLARAARGLALGFLENIVLWHERDLSNSSFERFAVPHLLLVIDQMLLDTLSLLDRLRVSPEAMRRNIEDTMYTIMTEKLMNMLIESGLPRRRAYELAREAARLALEKRLPLWEAAQAVEEIRRRLPGERLREELRPETYLGQADRLINEALGYARRIIEGEGC